MMKGHKFLCFGTDTGVPVEGGGGDWRGGEIAGWGGGGGEYWAEGGGGWTAGGGGDDA